MKWRGPDSNRGHHDFQVLAEWRSEHGKPWKPRCSEREHSVRILDTRHFPAGSGPERAAESFSGAGLGKGVAGPACVRNSAGLGDQAKAAAPPPDVLNVVAAMHLREERRDGVPSAHLVTSCDQEPVPLLVMDRRAGSDLSAKDL